MKELKEEISDLLEEKKMEENNSINSFFNLLFWKNYEKGYVECYDEILTEIKEATTNGNLDTKKILPFVNKIRKQIGLKELTAELDDILYEITPEITKRLILKRLE